MGHHTSINNPSLMLCKSTELIVFQIGNVWNHLFCYLCAIYGIWTTVHMSSEKVHSLQDEQHNFFYRRYLNAYPVANEEWNSVLKKKSTG